MYDTYFNGGVTSKVGFLNDISRDSGVADNNAKDKWIENLNILKSKIEGFTKNSATLNIPTKKVEKQGRNGRVWCKILQDREYIVEFEYYIK